ncbi:DUF3015 family protein [Thiogranum longum]|uniref:DUF3015 family protein n=1 Tax=Thiogranum longum TaxID=1537524 RepID=A0A4R1H9F2_9GAMM|nr:DUF3015 family protein [Thiogranum longum]TCK17918.1 DUF3015 family protein [Thiogranum longum]
MKKTILAMTILAGSSTAFAANDNGSGCGVGAMIFEGQSGVAPHVLAATTNGTFGNQTFGMTSGTLGCEVDQPISVAAADFLDNNMDKVARDMATGTGEALDTLANLMGISAEDSSHFKTVSHAQFATIFSSDSVHSSDVISALNQVMKQDEMLAKYAS